MTMGIVLPEANSTEFIFQLVAPVTYGWTGVSMGGQMADSLLFVMWPYNDGIILSSRWAS